MRLSQPLRLGQHREDRSEVQARFVGLPVGGFEAIEAAIQQSQIGATRREGGGDGAAEVACRAGHQDGAIGEVAVSVHCVYPDGSGPFRG